MKSTHAPNTANHGEDEFMIPMASPGTMAASDTNPDGTEGSDASAGQIDSQAALLDIDLGAIVKNYQHFDALSGPTSIAPVVKCNAYGLGADVIAAHLADNYGARSFFVATVSEGLALRRALRDTTNHDAIEIFVLNGPGETSLTAFADAALTPVINSVQQATFWASAYPGIDVALHVDTGMNRLGVMEDRLSAIKAVGGLSIGILMSHLACATDSDSAVNTRQRSRFLAAATQFPGARLSLAASAGAHLHQSYHYSLIRAGISLYGYTADGQANPRLTPSATLSAPIIQIRTVKRGERVGYDGTWVAARPSKIATLAIGYGDGLPRRLSNLGTVAVGRQKFPIVGRISMDLTTIDITDAPSGLALGDRAEIFGKSLPLEDMAMQVDTIPYEILTCLNARVQKRYHL
ncbi:MAG: alanine racemase [Pseudomonadota bacterium]